MSDCYINDGINIEGCYKGTGGIIEVYIANKENVTAIEPTKDTDDTGIVTGITQTSLTYFQVFKPNKVSSMWEETIESEVANGAIQYNQSINLVFSKTEAAKRNIIKLLGLSDLIAIVKDFNNKYWILGEQNGLDLTEGTIGSGVSGTDLNGYNITLSGPCNQPAREVSADIIDDLFES